MLRVSHIQPSWLVGGLKQAGDVVNKYSDVPVGDRADRSIGVKYINNERTRFRLIKIKAT